MFTGIVEATGYLIEVTKVTGDLSVKINSGILDLSDVKLGDSIATNGVCLTVTELFNHGYSADISPETLSLTGFDRYSIGQKLNLEKALTISSRLGGHLVSGHVDGIAQVTRIVPNARTTEYWLSAPIELAKYIPLKGSVCIDGISLTVNEINAQQFKLTIVPHTIAHTTIADFQVGSLVNLEVDQIARYLERLLSPSTEQAPASDLSMALLKSARFVQ